MNKPLLFVLVLVAFPVHAEIYKCMDANGRAAYQEMPCENTKLKQAGTVKRPASIPDGERERMSAVADKDRVNLAATLSARAKAIKAEQDAWNAAYERDLRERAVVSGERSAEADERSAQAAEINAGRLRR